MLRSVQTSCYTHFEWHGVFGVAGQTKALFYWWIGFLEILHGATSHHTCQCETLRLLSHQWIAHHTRLFVHIAPLAVMQTEQSNSKGHQGWSENIPKSVGSDIIHYHSACVQNFFGPMMPIGHMRGSQTFFRKIIGRSGIVTSSSAVA